MNPVAAFVWDDVLGYLGQNEIVDGIITIGGVAIAGIGFINPILLEIFPSISGVGSILSIIGGILWLRLKWRKKSEVGYTKNFTQGKNRFIRC